MFGLLFSGIITLIIIGFVIISKTVIPAFSQVQKEIDNANTVIRENVLGMKVIKSFCIEENQSIRFDKYISISNNNLSRMSVLYLPYT